MTERGATVVVTSEETLPEIIDRVRVAGRGGHVVDLVVPIDSSLLLTASEFRALKEATDSDRLHVVLRTADPLRLQLSERLGIRAHAIARPKPVSPAASGLSRAPQSAVPLVVDSGDAAEAFEVPAAARTRDPEAHWPGLNGQEEPPPAAAHDHDDDSSRPARLANPPRRWLPVAAVLVLLVLATLAAMRLLVPQAVVTIVPKTEPVAASLFFDVTADGQPLDGDSAFAVASRARSLEANWTGTAPTTGVRVEPVDPATGTVELRNAANEPATVAAGTVVSTEEGVEFAFVDEVVVPAADAASGAPGAATGSVRAAAAGSGGNVDVGELGGRLPNGVYFSNRMEPTMGGTDREIRVVADADLKGLSGQAREAAPALAAQILAAEDEGQLAIPSSVVVADQVNTFDRAAGDEADAVALESVLSLDVMTYDGDAAAGLFESHLLDELGAAAPGGFSVDADRVAYHAPAEASRSEEGVRLEIVAEAEAAAVLDESERAALAAEVAGKSPEEAEAILAAVPEIASYSVEYQPGWFPQRMPGNAARISFETSP